MTKTKYASLFVIAAASIAFCAGCTKESVTNETETVDLAQAPDLFENPLQPNPLAPQPEDVVITVDGEEITHGAIMNGMQMQIAQLSRRMPPQQLMQMQGQIQQGVVDTIIANILLNKAAEASGLNVSDTELDEQIATIRSNVPEGLTLEAMLATNNVDMAEWKDGLRKEAVLGKLIEQKTADIAEATDEDASTFYNENINQFKVPELAEASHILIKVEEGDSEEAKVAKKAALEKIKADIAAGTVTFEDMAQEHSACPSGQRNGGSLGSFGRGQMVPSFEDAAFTLEIGTLSDIVETDFGYHLIKVTDRKAASTTPFEEVSDDIKRYLTGQKKQQALVEYISMLREKADIVYHEKNLDAGAEPAAE